MKTGKGSRLILNKKSPTMTHMFEDIVRDYVSKTGTSKTLFERAKKVIPGGATYQIRLFGPYPFYSASAKGAKLIDVDGNEYIDFWLAHFSLILGHGHPEVVNAVKEQLEKTQHFGTTHELEIKLAEQVVKMVPSVEMVRFSNTGTEATMYCVRLARSFTKRERIAKFEGGWHGGYDAVHIGVKPPFEEPMSSGLTNGVLKDTIVLPFNDLEAVEKTLRKEELACIILEPMLGAGGGIPADKEFLKGLRELCDEHGTLLVFDEIITGFRLSPGGMQEYYGVLPDLTLMGKILGGGFPIGAIGGKREIMELMNPIGKERKDVSFHGGTFCGNPISMIAGLTTLKILEDGSVQKDLNSKGERLRAELHDAFEGKGIDVFVSGLGSVVSVHFTKEEVKDIRAVFRADRKKLLDYHLFLISKGIFFLPGHIGVLCTAHKREDFDGLIKFTEDYAKLISAE